MAKIFLLKFDSKKISEINISDFINLFENKYEYIYDEPFGGIPKEEMLKVKVSIPNILLGKTGKTTFGFYLRYIEELNYFTVRIATLATTYDYKVAIKFMIDFINKFGGTIIDDTKNTYDLETIKKYNYQFDILKGLNSVFNFMKKKNMDKVHLGSKNILTLRKNDLSQILKSDNPILNFDNLAKENTIFDKYRPEQKFFLLDNENNMMGYYELNKDKTVLKVSPSIEGRNSEFINEYGDIKAWGILLSEKLPPVDYYLALNHIQKEKIKPFGIDNILIENFNKNDRKKLFTFINENLEFVKNYIQNNPDYYIDYYGTHYNKIINENLNLGRLNSLTHLGFFLKFMIEKDLVSDYFIKYYSFLKDSELDIREVILYSMQGILGKFLFSKKGLSFIEKTYPKYLDILNSIEIESIENNENKYLFIPFEDKYYKKISNALNFLFKY